MRLEGTGPIPLPRARRLDEARLGFGPVCTRAMENRVLCDAHFGLCQEGRKR